VIVSPFVPLDVHTEDVVVEKVTGRPDDAVALTVKGDCWIVRVAIVPNVMDWLAFDTVNERLTLVAALYVAFPV
jgi:hypothetical protein